MENLTSKSVPALLEAIKAMGFNAEIIDEDYEEHGGVYGVEVLGRCANIRILNDDYDMGFVCTVEPLKKYAENEPVIYAHSGVSGGIAQSKHTFEFILKSAIESFDANSIAEAITWLSQVEAVLTAGSEQFYRVDTVARGDLSGNFKYGNGLTSYDCFRISDKNFHTDSTIFFFEDSEKETPVPITKENLDFY